MDRTYLIERPHSHNRSTFEEIFEDGTLLSTPLRDFSVNDTNYVKTLHKLTVFMLGTFK